MDLDSIGTGLTILGTAIGSKELVVKVLGPTADYIGGGLQHWTEKSVSSVARIFTNAGAKLGERKELPGAVPPKVLRGILQEGAFCDDELAGEYFGGVLASSRSEISRDDRGAAFISLISRLTSYQIRAHFVFYHIIKNIFDGESLLHIGSPDDRKKWRYLSPGIPISQRWISQKRKLKRYLLLTYCLVWTKSHLLNVLFMETYTTD
ncbi:MAG TPA: hypothetical protein VGA94_03730 [Thermodesulfobacteriota bacterium]